MQAAAAVLWIVTAMLAERPTVAKAAAAPGETGNSAKPAKASEEPAAPIANQRRGLKVASITGPATKPQVEGKS
jgi:hypothetical protein